MTDSDILEALEAQIRVSDAVGVNYCDGVPKWFFVKILALINRQKAEIERLNALIICKNKIIEGLDKSVAYAYDKGIQEFAEKLKNKAMTKWDYHEAVDVEDIDNLVKEMVGE